ncbi:hypothetical protein C4D60_Mb01t03670 [Musa balbisiana]|uniref:Uncharacterized protein n=1 Tax=Musa balbisiana TaxID=52838 RepID=A0A4S8JKX6_MUSBA|nr:hypothetical protein C4D60_Mb01t03670 [Musa balbisiana]
MRSPQERNTRLENVLANLDFDPQEEGANNTCPHPNAKGWAISLSHKHSTEAYVTNANAYIYTKHCIRFETHSALVHKLSSSFPLSHSLYI